MKDSDHICVTVDPHVVYSGIAGRIFMEVDIWSIDWFIHYDGARLWFIDYYGVRLCLRTSATNGPIVHPPPCPPGDMWAWRAMVMMPTGDNSWLVYQSSQAVLPADISVASRMTGRRSENFACSVYETTSLICRKILRHGTSGFTSHPKEGVLRIFIAIKNPSPQSGLSLRPLGPVTSTLTATPPRRLIFEVTYKRSEKPLGFVKRFEWA
jgi:hypothetical protein